MKKLKRLSDFNNENVTILKSLEMINVSGSRGEDSCWSETDPTDSDTGPCDTRTYNYVDACGRTILASTSVLIAP